MDNNISSNVEPEWWFEESYTMDRTGITPEQMKKTLDIAFRKHGLSIKSKMVSGAALAQKIETAYIPIEDPLYINETDKELFVKNFCLKNNISKSDFKKWFELVRCNCGNGDAIDDYLRTESPYKKPKCEKFRVIYNNTTKEFPPKKIQKAHDSSH